MMECINQEQKTYKCEFKRVWIKSKDLLEILNISRAMLSKLMKEEDFPKPIRLTYNLIRWNADEIEQWRKRKEQELNNANEL